MKTPPRIAVVGLGSFGELHARTLAGLPEAQLTGLVDQRPGRAQELAGVLGVPYAATSLSKLLSQTPVDGVIIATRTETHAPLALEATRAGAHVLIEKPAGSLEDIEMLLGAIPTTGRAAMVNHICLFHSLTAPLVARVSETGFRALHFVRHRPAYLAEKFPEEHPVTMTMVHDLYVAAQMARGEDPVEFHLIEAGRRAGHPADMSWATLRWADGRVATFHAHWTLSEGAPSDGWDGLEVFGNGYQSKISTNPAAWQWTDIRATWPIALEISECLGRPTGMLAEAQRSFIAVCQDQPVPPGCRLEDARQIARWTERLFSSLP